MARRYLGVAGGDRYIEENAANASGGGDVLIRMRPERWLTADYGKAGG
jgi:hypothetical protein